MHEVARAIWALAMTLLVGWLTLAVVLIFIAGGANAQPAPRCAPAAQIEEAFGRFRAVDLDAAQRMAFADLYNALPPVSDMPVPARILAIDDGRRLTIAVAPAEDAALLCLYPVGHPELAALLRRFIGRAA